MSWAAIPASAAPLTSALTPGSLPTQISAFAGGSQQAAISAKDALSVATATTVPADPSVAAGANYVVEAVDGAVFVFPRAGGAAVHTFDINDLARTTTTKWTVQDPKVIYDPFSGRFILAVVQYDSLRSGCTHDGSQIQVVVSNADPTTAWQTAHTFNNLAVLPNDTAVDTDVSLGMTSTVVALAWDYSSCVHGTPVASQTDIVQRSDLTSGALGVNSARAFTGGPLGIQPAMALGLSSVEYEIANDATCSTTAADNYAIFSYSGTPEAKNVTGPTCADSGTETSGTNAPPSAAQGGTSATLQTGDDRFLDLVWGGSNMLWATGNWGCTPSTDTQVRSCVNVVTATATTAGAVSSPAQLAPEGVKSAYLYYPSLALDSSGNAILTFDESSATAAESIQLATIIGTTWSSFTTVHPSTTFYSPSGCSSCAWGAYSGAVQDPLHPTDVWVVSADDDATGTSANCATVNTCWDTYIARYTFAGPSISSLTPSTGSGSGGTVVTVAGSDFATGTTVTFAGNPIVPNNLTPDSFTFTTPPEPPGPNLVYVVATDTLGSTAETPASSFLYVPLSDYMPVSPFRILDTRPPGGTGPIAARSSRTVPVAGVGSHPVPSTAVAAVLNVTAVGGSTTSYLAVYPAGTPVPNVSSLNFVAGAVTPNLVTVTLGAGGAVSIYNSAGTVNVVVDVEGYFMPPVAETPAGEFHPIAPTRVCDTRYSTYACHGTLTQGGMRLVTVAQGTIPNSGAASAVVLNLIAVAGTEPTYLTVFPTSSSGTCSGVPGVSSINVSARAVYANRVMVQLGPTSTGGPPTSVCVYNSRGTINFVLDANGWYGSGTAATGYQFQATAPARICDTRHGSATCSAGGIGAGASRLVGVAGQGGVPLISSGTVVQAVIANVAGISPSQLTYLIAYSALLTTAPGSSDINLAAGDIRDNMIVVQLDTVAGPNDGFMELYNAAGAVNATVDVEGWFQ